MRVVDVIGAFLMGALVVAGLSVVVNPNSRFAAVLDSFGEATSNVIKSAKA